MAIEWVLNSRGSRLEPVWCLRDGDAWNVSKTLKNMGKPMVTCGKNT